MRCGSIFARSSHERKRRSRSGRGQARPPLPPPTPSCSASPNHAPTSLPGAPGRRPTAPAGKMAVRAGARHRRLLRMAAFRGYRAKHPMATALARRLPSPDRGGGRPMGRRRSATRRRPKATSRSMSTPWAPSPRSPPLRSARRSPGNPTADRFRGRPDRQGRRFSRPDRFASLSGDIGAGARTIGQGHRPPCAGAGRSRPLS